MTSLLSVQDDRVATLVGAALGPGGTFQIMRWYTFDGEERTEKTPGEKLVSASLRWSETELCPLTYRHTLRFAHALELRLPTRNEAYAFARFPHVPIQTLPWNDPRFSAVEGTQIITSRIDAARPTMSIVDNEGKYWVDGASPGWALLVGFFNSAGLPANTGAGAPGKPGYGPKGEPHNDLHVDYSMAPRFVWC